MADLSILISTESVRISETLIVPTRIYLPSGTVPIEPSTNPAFDAAWNSTGAAVRRKPVTDGRKKGTAAASVQVTSAATNPEKILLAQYVSGPLRAQTISGNVSGQIRALESNAAFNGTLQIGIRVFSADGATVRATLLAVGGTTTTATTPPEFATALTNRRFLTSGDVTPLPLTSYTCVEGDRLVIEIGVADKDAGTARTASLSFGDNTVDLTVDDTTTTANDPWVEFDTTIQFQTAVETARVSDGGTAQLMNQGWVKIDQQNQLAAAIGLGSALFDKERVRLAESLAVALDLGVAVTDESLKCADGPATGLIIAAGLLVSGIDETLKLAETHAETLNPLETAPADTLKLADGPPTILPIWMVTAGPESLKLSDIGNGRADLYGVLHIADGPPAAALIAGADLSSNVAGETPKLADTVTASRDLTPAVADEAVKLADTPATDADRSALVDAEALRIAESQALALDPLRSSPTEAPKPQDGPPSASLTTALGGTPASEDPIHVAEGPAVGELSPLQPTAALQEGLRLTDAAASAAASPIQASAIEVLRLADGGQGRVDLVSQPQLHLADGPPVASLSAAGNGVSLSESLSLSDSVSTQLPTLLVQVGTETVRISDRVTILSVVINETVRLSDVGGGQTRLIGTLRLQDGPVQAQVGGNISAAVTEALRLGDPLVGAERSPFEPGLLTETVKIGYTQSEVDYSQDEYARLADSVSVDLSSPTSLSTAVADETLHLVDTASMNRDIARQLANESLRLADAASMVRTVEATAAETMRLTDAPGAARDIEPSVAAEDRKSVV